MTTLEILFKFSMLITFATWLTAFLGSRNLEINKLNAKVILFLIFWPIGLPYVIGYVFWKLFKTAFGEEED